VDAGYEAMIRAIRSDNAPNLALLQYSPSWSVVNLLVVPNFFFTETAIERRNPLSTSARRANWVGCNILLDRIPSDGRIAVVANGVPINPSSVRKQYTQALPLRELDAKTRGWTLDVLRALQTIGKRELALSDIYVLEESLRKEHPNNKHIKAKIRQQLQVLRDLGFLAFEARGRYRLAR
jgi:type II restriction enzyme